MVAEQLPEPVADSPSATNTEPNPATNHAVVMTMRRVCTRGSSCESARSRPVTIER